MERRIRKVVVWMMAVVISVIVSGWGMEAKAAISTSAILDIDGTPVVNGGLYPNTKGKNWKYDKGNNILTITNNTKINTITCKYMDLNIKLEETNKIGKIIFNGSDKSLKISGSGSLEFTGTNEITAKSFEINNTRVTANSIPSTATITNSCIKQGNQITVYGNVTLKEKLTVGSSDTITYKSGATISNPNLLEIKDGATIKYDKIQFKATSSTGWTYSGNTLTLTNTNLSDVKCTSGNLNIQLTGTNTINGLTVNSSSSNLNITGSGLLNLTGMNTINVSNMKIDGVTVKADSIKNTGGTSTITNSCIIESNLVTVYGEVTLQEKLTVGSGETINFQEGSITNLEKLTVDENAIIQVNGEIHKHNTDASYQWKDENTHIQSKVCKDTSCPIKYSVKVEETHTFSENNGFCDCSYQPAVLTTDKYDIDGDGTKDEVYEISNAGQLYWFAALVNRDIIQSYSVGYNAVLTKDIIVNKNVLDEEGNLSSNSENFRKWIPIGIGDNSLNNYWYNGIFDGQGHTISGLYCNSSNAQRFGFVNNADSKSEIRNLSFVDLYFAGDAWIGSFVFQNKGKIENCFVSGKLEAFNQYGGSLGGICVQNHGTITKCQSVVELKTTWDLASICSANYGTGIIENCYGKGGEYAISYNQGKIKNCYSINSKGGIARNEKIGTVGVVENSYYVGNDGEYICSGTLKTEEQFASGEVAYLLQGNQEEKIWGQEIGKDAYPVLGGTKVYQSKKYMACNREYIKEYVYSNDAREDTVIDKHLDDDLDGKCDGCSKFMDDVGAHLIGYTLSLDGDIGVNFYMELAEGIVNNPNAYMELTLEGKSPQKILVKDARKNTELKEGTTYYVFQCKVNANEMTKIITAQMFDGTSKCGKEYSYTVRDYAMYLKNHEVIDGAGIFAMQLLNYGASAQRYFGVKTDDLADSQLVDYEKGKDNIKAYYDMYQMNYGGGEHSECNYGSMETFKRLTSKNDVLGKFIGSSLVLKSETTLNVFYEPNEGVDISKLTFKIGDEVVQPIQRGKYYVLSRTNIKAMKLAEDDTFTVTDGTNTLTGNYCALSYCYNVLSADSGTYEDKLVTLVEAFANYYYTARNLFDNMNE